MIGTDVITNRARPILDDEYPDGNAAQRWTNAILIIWLNEGSRLIAEKRPESLLTAPYTQAAYADISVIGGTVILADKYRSALVDFVVARALAQDAQDERDLKRSKDHMLQFEVKAGLVPYIKGSE